MQVPVVIAIIAVLAGMLLPALGGVKKSAHKTSCVSNLKQIGMLFWNYSNDYNEFIVHPSGLTYYGYAHISSWGATLNWLYLKNRATVNKMDELFFDPACNPHLSTVTDYGMNYAAGGLVRSNSNPAITYRTVDFKYPSLVYVIMDSRNISGDARYKSSMGNLSSLYPPAASVGSPDTKRHGGPVNILHLDGHVETRKVDVVNPYLTLGTKNTNKVAWGWQKD